MLRSALAAGLGLALAAAGFAWVLFRGWHVTQLQPAQLSNLLRPFDEIVVPEGEGPFPTVLLFHGCGGKRPHISSWAGFFRSIGYAAVAVDSFAGRGLAWRDVCRGRALWGAERAGDVLVSLDDARRLPFVDRERIVLAGWSHGGWAVMDLLAMNPPEALPTNLAAAPESPLAGVAGVVLFYPYCGAVTRARWAGGWTARIPALFLLAGADSVVDSEACRAVAADLEAGGHAVAVTVYAGADHSFDVVDQIPGSPLVYHPEATADARRRVGRFLARLARSR